MLYNLTNQQKPDLQSNQPTKTRFTIKPTNKKQIYNPTNYQARCCTIQPTNKNVLQLYNLLKQDIVQTSYQNISVNYMYPITSIY